MSGSPGPETTGVDRPLAEPPTGTPLDPAGPPDLGIQLTPGAGAIRRWLLFVAAAGLLLGVAALRHGLLLRGRIDPDLVTTPEAALVGAVAIAAELLLAVLVARAGLTARRWLAGVRGNLRRLSDLGLVGTAITAPDGTVRRQPGPDTSWLLVAVVPRPPALATRPSWAPGIAESARSARVVLGVAGIAVGPVVAGSLALLVAGSRDVASVLWLAVGIGALLLAPACGALAWLVADIDRREAAAISAADPRRLLPPEPENRWAGAAIGVLVALAFALPSINLDVGSDWVCTVQQLECRWIVVQADQLANDPRGATTELHYGLWRATGTRRGTLVFATGGPGVSGMAAWEASYETIDPRLTAAFDIVAFDPRGVGQSGYVDCPAANERYANGLDFEADRSVIDGFVTSCLLETGLEGDDLGYFASAQVAEDIDTIRRDLGAERIVLYGESYGTAVAQRYALAHPDRLDALILDGPVDIARSTDRVWRESAASFEDVLQRTFRACRADPWCDEDLPDPDRAWRRMMARLGREPVQARYANDVGSMTTWEVTEGDAIGVLGDALYEAYGRSQLLHALAAADRDDWVPLARLIHSGFWGGLAFDRSVSEFVYHATLCADRVVASDDAGDAGSYLEAARDSPLATAHMGTVYLSGAACHAWPLPATPPPPASLPASAAFPVFVLTATGDPITPASAARGIAERYAATTAVYLIETTDGPHVTFGRGEPCPDETVIEFLVDGTRPLAPEVHCRGVLLEPYTGLVVPEADEDGASYRARALDAELLIHPDYLAWDGKGELAIGCRHGGRLVVTPTDTADEIGVERCEVVERSPMSGTGEYREDGTAWFEVTFPRGRFRYEITADGGWTLEGIFDGKAVENDG